MNKLSARANYEGNNDGRRHAKVGFKIMAKLTFSGPKPPDVALLKANRHRILFVLVINSIRARSNHMRNVYNYVAAILGPLKVSMAQFCEEL